MLPILKISSDGKPRHRNDFVSILTEQFNLNQEERNRLKPSGGQTLFENRIGWATFDLNKAGLIKREKGIIIIIEDGKKILSQNPSHIDRKFLLSIPKYVEFNNKMIERRKDRTPEEICVINKQWLATQKLPRAAVGSSKNQRNRSC